MWSSVRVAGLGVAFLLALWGARAISRGRVPVAFALFVLLLCLSVLWSANPIRSLAEAGGSLALCIVALLIVQSANSVLQFHRGSSFGLSALVLGSGLVELVGFSVSETTFRAATGVFVNPNILTFVCVLAFALWFLCPTSPNWGYLRTGTLVASVLLVAAAMSLGGVVILSLVVAKGLAGVRRRAVSSAVVFTLIGLVSLVFWESIMRATQKARTWGSMDERFDLWSSSLGAGMDRPLLGYGRAGLTDVTTGPAALRDIWEAVGSVQFNPHNGVIEVFLELGATGLLLLGVFVVQAGIQLFRTAGKHHGSAERLAMRWLRVLSALLLIYNLVESRLLDPPLAWFYVCMLTLLAARRE